MSGRNNLFEVIECCQFNQFDFIVKQYKDTSKIPNVRHNQKAKSILYCIEDTLIGCNYIHEPFQITEDDNCIYTIIPSYIISIIYKEFTKSKAKDRNKTSS